MRVHTPCVQPVHGQAVHSVDKLGMLLQSFGCVVVHNSGGVRESLQLPAPHEVALQPAPPERLIALLDPAQADAVRAALSRAPRAIGGRTTVNINSTAAGGGVAEMLGSLLPYTL